MHDKYKKFHAKVTPIYACRKMLKMLKNHDMLHVVMKGDGYKGTTVSLGSMLKAAIKNHRKVKKDFGLTR